MESVQTLVSHVERALKLVSDELANHAEEGAPAEPGAAPQRMLKGVMRVGLLAKGLMLKGDRLVQLVVLCSQPPTYQLLETVTKALPAHLAVNACLRVFRVGRLLMGFLLRSRLWRRRSRSM